MALLQDSVIAHYKMNENTSGDNAELVTNGDFSAWTADDPDSWTVAGEVGADPEVSEVGTGEGHGGVGTGMCNIYTSDGTLIQLYQDIVLVVGRKYRVSINIDTIISGTLTVDDLTNAQFSESIASTGIYTFTFVATASSARLNVKRRTAGANDVTFDDVSVKLLAIEDSSGNDHDGIAQQDSDLISVAGKINTALEFNGSSDYIIIPDHDDFTPALTAFSISAWVNMDDATNFTIASKGVYNTDGEWRFGTGISNDKITFRLYDESEASTRIARYYDTVLTSYQNQWIHLVATYDGGIASSGIKIYLNGVRIDDADANAGTFVAVENLTHDVWIGRYDTSYANGTIDNVMFFNKELTQLDIDLLYNAGAGVEDVPIGIYTSSKGQRFSSFPEN